MKKRNSTRNLLMIALLVGGIFTVGAGNQTFAQDRSGYLNSTGRSGYISASGGTGSTATTSTTDSSRSGYLVAGNRAENTSTTQQSSDANQTIIEPESENLLNSILAYFF
jgi:hypothetical protein